MLTIDPLDPDLDWDAFDPEDLVAARIRTYLTEDGEGDRIDLAGRKAAEAQLRARLNDDQNKRRDQHKAAEAEKKSQQIAQLFKGGPAFEAARNAMNKSAPNAAAEAFKKLGITNSLTSSGKPEDLVGSKTKHVSVDIPEYEPAPNPVPEKLDHLIEAANTAAANSEERAKRADESAASSKFWAITSAVIAVVGIATTIIIAVATHHPQTPPQPVPTPTIKQTIE